MHRPPAAGLALGLITLLGLLVMAFAWPTSQLAPRDVPLVVAGPAQAVDGVERALAENAGPDAFTVTLVDSPGAARAALEERDAYGALVLSPTGMEVLTAPAASPAVAQLLSAIAQSAPGGPATVTEVVPLPAGDPRGAVFGSGSLPVVLGGIATGAVAALLVRRSAAAAAVVAGVALGAASLAVLVLQGWLDALRGDWWANLGVLALGLAAIALVVAGLGRALGRAGVALGALSVLLLGNPFSGATSAPELLPGGWSELGQLMPPGAATQALRSTAFFEGAGAGGPLLVLGAWIAAGLVLIALPGRRTTAVGQEPAQGSVREPAAATA